MDTDTAEKVLETLHIILVKDYSPLLSPYLGAAETRLWPYNTPRYDPNPECLRNWFSSAEIAEIHHCQAQIKYTGLYKDGEERDVLDAEQGFTSTKVE